MDVREKLVEVLDEFEVYRSEVVAQALIESGVTVQEWISVKDRLPDTFQVVLTASDTGCIDVGFVDKIGVWVVDLLRLCKVTHWMPLPEPPKGE